MKFFMSFVFMLRGQIKKNIAGITHFFCNASVSRIFVIFSVLAVLLVCIFGWVTWRYSILGRTDDYGFASDAVAYWDLSSSILNGQGLVYDAGSQHNLGLPSVNFPTYLHQRLPGYSFFLGLERMVFNLKLPFRFSYVNLLLVALNCFIFLQLFKRFFSFNSRLAYFLPAVLLLLAPPILIYSNGINSDFLTASLLLYFYYFFTSSGKLQWLSIIFCVLAIFTKSNVLVFVVPFLFFSLLQNKRKYLVFTLIVCVILSTGIWSYRNYKLSGYFSLTSMNGVGALRVNYLVPNIWPPNSFARKILFSDIKNSNEISRIILVHAGELGSGMDFDGLEKDVLKVLDSNDRGKWDAIFSDFKKEKFINQKYYARWNSWSYIGDYFNKLSTEKNVYYAAFRIDKEITKDVVEFVFNNKLVATKTILMYRVPAILAYDIYTRDFSFLVRCLNEPTPMNILKLAVWGSVIVSFYVLPIVCLFVYLTYMVLVKQFKDDKTVLACGCVSYFILTLLVLGVTSRYLMPIYYFILLYLAFYVNHLTIYLKKAYIKKL